MKISLTSLYTLPFSVAMGPGHGHIWHWHLPAGPHLVNKNHRGPTHENTHTLGYQHSTTLPPTFSMWSEQRCNWEPLVLRWGKICSGIAHSSLRKRSSQAYLKGSPSWNPAPRRSPWRTCGGACALAALGGSVTGQYVSVCMCAGYCSDWSWAPIPTPGVYQGQVKRREGYRLWSLQFWVHLPSLQHSGHMESLRVLIWNKGKGRPIVHGIC